MKKLMSLLIMLCILFTCSAAYATIYDGYTAEGFAALDKTTVVKSEDSPTGYFVTFRYVDPDATRVRVFGEWMFSALDPVVLLHEREQGARGVGGRRYHLVHQGLAHGRHDEG